MARNVATLLLLFAYGSCMEMRETVERTVMVRTSGSDLQPAATGYIYKKESDGPASVTKMGESEVMEQLSKLYSKPQAFEESGQNAALRNAPQPHPGHKSESYVTTSDDSDSRDSAPQSSALNANEEVVKPVVEVQQGDDKIDGIADEEFDKLFEDYMKKLDYKDSFADYLHGLNNYDHGIYHGYGHGDGQDHGFKRYRDYGARDQKTHEGQRDGYLEGIARYYGYKDDDHKSHYDDKHDKYTHRDDNQKASQGEEKKIGRFHTHFADEFKKDNDFYDGGADKGAYKYARGFVGARGEDSRDADDSDHYKGYFGGDKLGAKSRDEHDDQASKESGDSGHHREFGIKEHRAHTGKSYGFEIKH